jgi:hypothetical protein
LKINEGANFSNIRKKDGEIVSPENTKKIKTAYLALEKNGGSRRGPLRPRPLRLLRGPHRALCQVA